MAKKTNAVYVLGSVRLRQHGRTWQMRYMTPEGRVEKTTGATSLKNAQKIAREVNDLLERGDYETLKTRSANQHLTFRTFVHEEFLPNYRRWSDTTREGNRGTLNKLCEEFGDKPLNVISTRQLAGYLARRRDQDDLTEATCNRYLATLKTVFKQAQQWSYIGFNPAEPIQMTKEDQVIPNALSEDELGRLLRELPEPAKSIVRIAADTGMRKGELQRLAWADVDFESHPPSVIVRHSKNGEFRVIPMTQPVYDILKNLRQQVTREKVVSLQVFPVKDIKRPLTRAAERAGIGHVHLHMLRHTFATRLRDRGVPLDRIKELLGQKTMEMVLRYAKANPKQLEEAIQALGG